MGIDLKASFSGTFARLLAETENKIFEPCLCPKRLGEEPVAYFAQGENCGRESCSKRRGSGVSRNGPENLRVKIDAHLFLDSTAVTFLHLNAKKKKKKMHCSLVC